MTDEKKSVPEAGGLEAPTSLYDEAVQLRGLSETHLYLISQIPPHSPVLELGPASGYMTKILAGKGCVVDAIEISEKDAYKAAPYCRKIVVGSVESEESFASLTGPYRVVLMADILEHLRMPEKTLAQVRRRLAPEGTALVSLPNVAYWRMRLELMRGRFDYTDTGLLDRTHLRFYTLKTATEMFTAAGFRVVRVVVPPHNIPRFGRLKQCIMEIWPTLFSFNFVYHLCIDGT